ncbi:hypothetical protein [Actinokineospora sp. NBRC 105648]|uniref:hypothetical protein n=1 Tax=Actinokineospora sp. NBRC 105648 TaxID=3032206 RepID=UPI0024A55A42|nr:hypothetical protein [Actinokineospora sp. NBRC 105648]GLZ37959.1 hypothetical protein Acsp05_15830 [Actinokineospora sp. NBRC 105648]
MRLERGDTAGSPVDAERPAEPGDRDAERYGADVRAGVDHHRHGGGDHIPGVGQDPERLAEYLDAQRPNLTHVDTHTGDRAGYDADKGMAVVHDSTKIYARHEAQAEFAEGGRYTPAW